MSLRIRLAVIAVAVLAVTLVCVAGIAYQLSRVQGRVAIDRVLYQELEDLAIGLPELLPEGDASPAMLTDAVQRYLSVHPGSDRHLTVVTVGSDRLSTSDGPPEALELLADGGLPEDGSGLLRTTSTRMGPMRVLNAPLRSQDGADIGSVTVLGPLTEVRADATDALTRVAVAGSVGLALGGAALVVVSGRALAPLQRLAEAARSTGGGDLSARVPEPERHDEVGTVAHEFNRMLDRMTTDTERRQELLAAISHELRTPVAVASGHLEMFEALGPTDEHTAMRIAGVVRHELDRLSRIIEDLSAVAHGALGARLDLGPVFLPDVYAEVRHRVAGLALTKVTVEAPPPLVIEADSDRITQCLLNLVVNADIHTPARTAIRLSARRDDSDVCLIVTDDGPGIPAALASRVFEPFVTSRISGPSRTTGLGLSVVKTLTEAQGGRVLLDTSPEGTTVTLRFAVSDV